MALIVCDYLNYFIDGRESSFHFRQGEVSFFDPTERRFLRINPGNGDVPQSNWIPLPIIKEVEAYKNYLRFMGNTSILQDYAHLDDFDFSVKVLELAERYDFERSLRGYVECFYGEKISNWIKENKIPNCKLRRLCCLIRIDTDGDVAKLYEYNRKQIELEDIQEEEFKKSLR